ncbi:MAG: hypothetical protein KDE22_16035 [Rhodobacterales bacterium]|nr:hypothetical protein [Rhodobacterales bacterium]
MGEQSVPFSLMHRGRHVKSLSILGSHVEAQYRCPSGYLVISILESYDDKNPFTDGPSTVSLYTHFIFEDFSGMEWEILNTDCPVSICRKPGTSPGHDFNVELAPFDVCQPLGENELVIRLKDREVYRISVHVPPKRFLLARDESDHFGPSFLGRRYLKIRSVAAPWKLGIPALSD